MGAVLVVGTGLIGASIGLALHPEREVLLTDTSADRLELAVNRGAGRRWDGRRRVELAVLAVPPARTASLLAELLAADVADLLTHVAGCQSQVQRELATLGPDLSRICGGHPLAGRETAGPAAASADLFRGRPWICCPGPDTAAAAEAAVLELAVGCGAEPSVMSALDHDRAVAVSSHLPQVAASALAAQLTPAGAETVAVSGPGLQDTTRIAGSDAGLWTEVLAGNAAQVAPLVARLGAELTAAAHALGRLSADPADPVARAAVRDLLLRGNAGRALVPVKTGVLDRDVVVVGVRVPDEPGQLAGLLGRAAAAGVNVEDVRVEHLTGRPTGIVELLVRSAERDALTAALRAASLEVLRSS